MNQLDGLKSMVRATTRAEVVRSALAFYGWTLDQSKKENAKFLLEKDGKQKEIVFLSL